MKREDKLFFVLSLLIWTMIYGISFYLAAHEPEFKTQVSSTLPHMTVDAGDKTVMAVESERAEEAGEELSGLDDYDKSSGGEATSVITKVLAGTYESKSGDTFYFGPNSYYSGFFDSEHTDMEGGAYEISEEDGLITIKIISSDAKRTVTYKLQMNGPKNYTLIYEPTDFKIELEKKDE